MKREYVQTKLTDLQRKFCEAFVLNGGDAAKAMKEAGYNVPITAMSVVLNSKAVQKEIDLFRLQARTVALAKFGDTYVFKLGKLIEIAKSKYKSDKNGDKEV